MNTTTQLNLLRINWLLQSICRIRKPRFQNYCFTAPHVDHKDKVQSFPDDKNLYFALRIPVKIAAAYISIK